MFYCPLHSWYSSEEPCPACHPVVTVTTTSGVFNPNESEQKLPSEQDKVERPPIGVIPEWRWKELRLKELGEAIQRHVDSSKKIPHEWIGEQYELGMWLLNKREKSKTQDKAATPVPEKNRIKFAKDASDFIEMAWHTTDNWYWTDFFYKKVGDCLYELWSADKLPASLKELIRPKLYTQKDLDEAIEKAFNAARMIVHSGSSTETQLEKALQASIESMAAYKDSEDYKHSLSASQSKQQA